MADVNVYTARRLKSMALSLGGLAQAFADEIGGQGHLTKEDGLAAMQTAASAVCGDCTRCNLYYGNRRDGQLFISIICFGRSSRRENRPGGHAAPVS